MIWLFSSIKKIWSFAHLIWIFISEFNNMKFIFVTITFSVRKCCAKSEYQKKYFFVTLYYQILKKFILFLRKFQLTTFIRFSFLYGINKIKSFEMLPKEKSLVLLVNKYKSMDGALVVVSYFPYINLSLKRDNFIWNYL